MTHILYLILVITLLVYYLLVITSIVLQAYKKAGIAWDKNPGRENVLNIILDNIYFFYYNETKNYLIIIRPIIWPMTNSNISGHRESSEIPMGQAVSAQKPFV